MQINITILFALICFNSLAQDCPKYKKSMEAGDLYLDKTKPPNYDSALIQYQVAQIAARECNIVADLPAKKLKQVFEGLKLQRDEALKQKNAAIEATKLAEQEKKRANLNESKAVFAQQQTEAQKDAFRLITVAQQKVADDPTLALRIAEAALKKYPDSLIYTAAEQIYQRHAFYKTIIIDSFSDFNPLVFSSDGTKILTTSNYQYASVRLWTAEGKLLNDFIGHTSPITSLSFSPNNKTFLSVSMDSLAILWNADSGTVLKKIKIETGQIWAAAFSPNGKTFVTGSDDSTIRLWDTSGVLLKEFKEVKGDVGFLTFLPAGDKIFACLQNSDTSRIKAFLLNIDGSLLKKYNVDNVYSGIYVFDTLKLIAQAYNEPLKIYNTETGTANTYNETPGTIYSLKFSPDGSKILIGSTDSVVRLLNLDGTIEKEFKGHQQYITIVCFSPDGMKIFSGAGDHSFKLWNREGDLLKVSNEKASGITSVAVSPDGKKIYTAYEDSTATLWTGSGSVLQHYGPFKSVVTAASFSSDGTEVYTGSTDSVLRLWSLKGDLLKEFEKWDEIKSIDVSPGTSEILVALNSNSVKLLNKKGNLMNEYKEYKGKVHAAFFSAKGIKIITSENRRYHQQVRIWDGDGKLLQNFSWPSRNFLSLTVSPDGTKLFGKNSYSGNAIIQDTSGKLLHEYRGEGGDFSCFAFSPDGSKIITGSQSGKLKWWETMLTMEEFLASGKIDELTAEQKREFGIR